MQLFTRLRTDYNIVSTSQACSHTLTILAKPGFQIYTFTFG
ncbi:MAG: hypothetical protein HY222_07470 [Thaumarchaeota archaeon]|nr:hypothetical protein [Nitrososphaerota archaeon]MBI3642214.1 hypothetical protein [Nitrososphaerota archaeon]